jgi:hypothetical protein
MILPLWRIIAQKKITAVDPLQSQRYLFYKILEAWAPCGTQEPHKNPHQLAFGHGSTFKWGMWRLKHLTIATSDWHLFPTLCFFALAGSTFKTFNFSPKVLKCSQKLKKIRNEVL